MFLRSTDQIQYLRMKKHEVDDPWRSCISYNKPLPASSCITGGDDYKQAAALYHQSKQIKAPAQKADYLRRALALCEAPEPYYDLGKSYMQLGDYDNALETFGRSLDITPDEERRLRGKIHGRRAHINLALDRINLALTDKDAAVELFDNDTPRWLAKISKNIDLHPKRQRMSARDIYISLSAKRSMSNDKGFSSAPSIDIFVTFKTDSDQPDERGSSQLGNLGIAVADLVDDEIKEILVIGHTDVRGDANYNQALSERRATTAVNHLAGKYPKLATRLVPLGRGESEPAHKGNSAEDHQLNRRVAIQLISK